MSSAPVAQEQLDLKWSDLVPRQEPLADPLAGLTDQQKLDIQEIDFVRRLSRRERRESHMKGFLVNARRSEDEFKKQGIDVDGLIAGMMSHQKASTERQQRVVKELDGKRVRIGGYLLPLDLSGKGVTEFLLVPFIGACIHVPPPPANQIVYVQLEKPYKVKDLFTPVSVAGVLKPEPLVRNLFLVDGASNIELGYRMQAQTIEVHKQ